MLDIQFIRNNADLVAEKSTQKGYKVDVPRLLQADLDRRESLGKVEVIRSQRNELSSQMKGNKPDSEQIEQGKKLKLELAELEQSLEKIEIEYKQLLKQIPNIPLASVPIGATEEENVVVHEGGSKRQFDFTPKPHWELLEANDMMDKKRAAKISGSRFAYLKGNLVRMQLAIMTLVMDTLMDEAVLRKIIDDNELKITSKPFVPVLPPAMLRTEPYEASARLDKSEVTYKLEDDDLWLNASAEHTLCTMYWNEILPSEALPVRYIGYSTSFRREAGTYGKDTEGIIRLHQFDKLEMEIFCTAETGEQEHKLQIAIQEHLVQLLGLPYRLLQKCTADIGKPNASGYDIDCWFPGQDRYIETHTADYMTDFQARDLSIRTRNEAGLELVHTNDATAFALSRILAAIVENYQQQDGTIMVPEALRKYMNNKEVI
jgi:seryl-tRNA synthetase